MTRTWILFALCALPANLPAQEVSERARRLHAEALVFDAHVHLINRQFHQGGDIGQRLPDGQVDLPRLKEGGVDAFFLSVFVQEQYYPGRIETRQALRLIDLALRQIEAHPSMVALALNAGDLERIHREGKIAAVLDIEGSLDLDGDLGILRNLYRLGLRSAQLPAHNWTNHYADSCCAPPKWNGLTDHGRALIREMNRLGMVINVSHAADTTLEQALEVSSAPLVATHHGLRHFNDIPRNMPDHLLRRLAAKGGLICFHIGNSFHNRKYFDWRTRNAGRPFWDTSAIGRKEAELSIFEVDRQFAGRYPMVGPKTPDEYRMTVDQWLKVVDYAIRLVGEDHVGLGSDFDGGPTPPRGIEDATGLVLLTEGMLRRGYSEDRIRKFLGGNLLRVFRQVTDR